MKPRQAWLLVGMLTFAYAVSFLDRTVLALLLQPIKQHYQLSDTQLGLLSGFGFVVFYLVLGLPIGRLVDRRDRRLIVAVGAVTWSIMTAACGLAPSFATLLLARLGVGAGESTVGPASFSMIGDAMPSGQQARALTVYSMGIAVGSALALIAGGWLIGALREVSGSWTLPGGIHLEPWQWVFLLASIPGFLAAAGILLVREPPRRERKVAFPSDSRSALDGVPAVIAYMRGQWQAFAAIIGGMSLLLLVGFGVGSWIPAFLIRVHGAPVARVGIIYGLISVVSGLLGAAAAGQIGSVLERRGRKDAALLTLLIALTGMLVFSPFTLAPTLDSAFAVLAVFMFFNGMPYGLGAAALNQITPARMRGTMSALFHLCINLVGVGMGPLLVGLLGDRVFVAADGLRLAMLSVALAGLPVLIAWLWAMRGRFAEARRAAEQLD
ncbi:MAG: MFS transporter [Steroidobacteraceae bacterium]